MNACDPQYMIETQQFGRFRWAWAISLPDPSGRPSMIQVAGVSHPFRACATKRVGGWNRRIAFGWAWSRVHAYRRAERAIDRHKRQRAGTAASERTYATKEAK